MASTRHYRKSQPYSKEEQDFIREYAGNSTIEYIARRLGRTPSGIKYQMNQLGCADHKRDTGTISAKVLSEILQVSHTTVNRWIEKKGLPAKKYKRYTKVTPRHQRYAIKPEAFWKWAKDHQELVNFSKIDPYSLLPEPEWVEAKRQEDLVAWPKQRIWTTKENQYLIDAYNQGVKQPDIAKTLNRSLRSVEARLRVLKKDDTNLPKEERLLCQKRRKRRK